jgi:uncharacterized coiled-coil protein SlyX
MEAAAPRRYGLILKGASHAPAPAKAAPAATGPVGGIFGEEDEVDGEGGRGALLREQAAARARSAAAAAALSAQGSAEVLDYDAWKEGDDAARVARSGARAAAAAGGGARPAASSRYISSLMAQATEREAEREAVLERKLARLTSQFSSLADRESEPRTLEDEKPPHY